MSWAEERRANRVAEAQIRREDAAAAAQVRIAERAAIAREQRADGQARVEARERAAAKRRARWQARAARARAWAAGHAVDLLVYPLAVVSAVLAVPAMAAYGHTVYGNATGYALFAITELGMWAFALGVQLTRRLHPGRPVWALQLGVWLFAGGAFAANALHGAERGLSPAVVMGIGSIAGVVAHQLITAGHRRTRAERTEAQIERRAARKVARVRRAAVRQAVAEIDPDGTARLVYAPGRYTLTGHRGRRAQLCAAIVPGLPTDTDSGAGADWDRELADLLADTGTALPGTPDRGSIDAADTDSDGLGGGSIATLDRDADQQKSSPDRGRIGGRAGRSIDQLRAELRAAIEARPHEVDPASAESIRKTLHCSPKTARRLRDEHRGGQK